jgi:hypothetical protein
MNHDITMAEQLYSDLDTIVKGAAKDIAARGGYAANPTASILLGCLLSILGAAGTGDLMEANDALVQVSKRSLAHNGREC